MERKAIDANIPHRPGTKEYLCAHPSAVSQVIDYLSDEKKVEYMKLAREWNAKPPPKEVQLK